MRLHSTIASALLLSGTNTLVAQQAAHRPPAVPLVANDPYFSIWSMADKLTDAPTKHWSEAPQPIAGLASIDGHVFRWMGTDVGWPGNLARIPAMQQISLTLTALHTRYVFAAGGIQLEVTFFTPSFPADLDVLSRPVTYLSWAANSTDGQRHKVSLVLDASPMTAVNDPSQMVTWGRYEASSLTVMRTGTRDQRLSSPVWPSHPHRLGLLRSRRSGECRSEDPDGRRCYSAVYSRWASECCRRYRPPATSRELARFRGASDGRASAGRCGNKFCCSTCAARIHGYIQHRVSGPQVAPLLATQWHERERSAGCR